MKIIDFLRYVPGLQTAVRSLRKRAHVRSVRRTLDVVLSHENYEILVVFGMRRSGNHVAINWILEQVDGPAVFYNNINPDKSPFAGVRTEFRNKSGPSPRLIISYEDVDPDRLLSPPLLSFLEDRVVRDGASVRFALILRDPYNLFASRLRKWPERFVNDTKIDMQTRMYQDLASLAAHPKSIWQGAPVVPIFYNDLVSDPAAREKLSARLGIKTGDAGLDDVPVYGHGSSFDGTELSGEAVRNNVFERWRALEKDPVFQKTLNDPELQAIGTALFNMIPPSTDEL